LYQNEYEGITWLRHGSGGAKLEKVVQMGEQNEIHGEKGNGERQQERQK
jgi:hypothetical protein